MKHITSSGKKKIHHNYVLTMLMNHTIHRCVSYDSFRIM